MKYMGSKRRIAKNILPIMLEDMRLNKLGAWTEPFVGGGNLIDKVPPTFRRLGSDLNPHVVAALTAIRDKMDELPTEVSEEYYRSLKGSHTHTQCSRETVQSTIRPVGMGTTKY